MINSFSISKFNLNSLIKVKFYRLFYNCLFSSAWIECDNRFITSSSQTTGLSHKHVNMYNNHKWNCLSHFLHVKKHIMEFQTLFQTYSWMYSAHILETWIYSCVEPLWKADTYGLPDNACFPCTCEGKFGDLHEQK